MEKTRYRRAAARLVSVRTLAAAGLLAAVSVTAGCGDDEIVVPEDGALFVVEVSGEEFRALVTDIEPAQDLTERMQSGTRGVVAGQLARGHGGFNQPWSWHWVPETVQAPDVAIELCDGRPSMVEEDLDYWIDTVGSFCPWGARVVRRER